MPYFDHNATTPLLAAAREAWLETVDQTWQNPSSPYRSAARAHRLLEEAREQVAAIVQVPPDRIVFTSGATEAGNAAFAWASHVLSGDLPAYVGATEHPGVLEPARHHFGDRCHTVPVDRDGRLDCDFLAERVRQDSAALVAVMAANNETGVLGPHPEVARLCAEHGVWYLCDASQWYGRLGASELPPRAFLVGCAHKFGGPKGVGFLAIPEGADGFSIARGGEQEHGRRSGTEDLPAIRSMVAALTFSDGHSGDDRDRRAGWRDRFVELIGREIPGIVIHGVGTERLWNTVSIGLPRFENSRWVARLDRRGFEVSTGSACATGSSAPSHVLAAMGVADELARRTIRVSSGWETTEEDWMALVRALAGVGRELSSESGDSTVIEA